MKKLKLLAPLTVILCLLFSVTALAGYSFVEGGANMASATQISLGTEYAAELEGDEVLYFKFTTPAQKGYFDFYAKDVNISTHSWSGGCQVQFELVDALDDRQSLIQLAEGYDASNNLPLETSTTYYIKVWNETPSDTVGNIKVSVSFTADKQGDSKSGANTVKLDKKYAATLDGVADVDYFKFKTGNWSSYTLKVQNVNISTHTWSSGSMFSAQILSEIDEVQTDVRCTYGTTNTAEVKLSKNTTYYLQIYNPEDGQGQYTFSITPVRTDIGGATTSYKTKFTYTGKAIKPSLRVEYNGKKLVKGTDYTVAYVNNTKPGVAKMVIKGKGNFKGKATLRYYISPKKSTVTASSKRRGKLTIKTKKNSLATGVQVAYSTSSKFKNAKKYSTTKSSKTATVTAKKGKVYYVKARSYKKVGKTYIFGSWSKTVKVRVKR